MKNGGKKLPRLKFEVLDEQPLTTARAGRHVYYDEVIDHLLTLETHQAMKVHFKDFVKTAQAMQNGLRCSAKRKKIQICSQTAEDHVTVWRVVEV